MRLGVAVWFLAPLTSIPMVGSAEVIEVPEPVWLVCRITQTSGANSVGGPKDVNLRVNYRENTVNKLPATITDGEILLHFTDTETHTAVSYRLNRYTGSIALRQEKAGNTDEWSGTCNRIAEHKF